MKLKLMFQIDFYEFCYVKSLWSNYTMFWEENCKVCEVVKGWYFCMYIFVFSSESFKQIKFVEVRPHVRLSSWKVLIMRNKSVQVSPVRIEMSTEKNQSNTKRIDSSCTYIQRPGVPRFLVQSTPPKGICIFITYQQRRKARRCIGLNVISNRKLNCYRLQTWE